MSPSLRLPDPLLNIEASLRGTQDYLTLCQREVEYYLTDVDRFDEAGLVHSAVLQRNDRTQQLSMLGLNVCRVSTGF